MSAQAYQRTVLRAIGIDVYVRRESKDDCSAISARGSTAGLSPSPENKESTSPILVVFSEKPMATDKLRCERLYADLLCALSLKGYQSISVHVDGSGPQSQPPESAHAWLVLGEHLKPSLDDQSPLNKPMQTSIVLAPSPGKLLGDARAKRALWAALKPLARRFRAA